MTITGGTITLSRTMRSMLADLMPFEAAWDAVPAQVARHEMAGLPGVSFLTIECHKPAGGWAVPHYITSDEFGLTLVRRGGFSRRANGVTAYVDPTVAYINLPGTVQQIGHPVGGGDDCTIIAL